MTSRSLTPFLFRHLYALSFIFFIICYFVFVNIASPLRPFVDLIAFSNLELLPSGDSFGEANYYVFQFTFILGHILLRILGHLHANAITTSHICYILQFALLWAATGRNHPFVEHAGTLAHIISSIGCLRMDTPRPERLGRPPVFHTYGVYSISSVSPSFCSPHPDLILWLVQFRCRSWRWRPTLSRFHL